MTKELLTELIKRALDSYQVYAMNCFDNEVQYHLIKSKPEFIAEYIFKEMKGLDNE